MRERARQRGQWIRPGLLLGALTVASPALAQLAPIAVNDAFTTAEDTQLNRNTAALGVRANDLSLDEPIAQHDVLVVTTTANGTLSLAANGGFLFTPSANFNGTTSFTYQLRDPLGLLSNVATATITVTAVNDAPTGVVNRSYSTPENVALTVPAGSGLLAGVTDVDGNAVSAQVVTNVPPAAGTLSATPNGAFTFTPAAGFSGTTSFTYRAVDNAVPPAQSATATVTLTVTNVNDPPVANPNTYSTNEDTPLTVLAPGVLTGDTDPDAGTVLSAVLVTSVPSTAGTLALNANGSFVYTPALNFSGATSFTYRARDNGSPPRESVAAATVTINVAAVNDAPVAVADIYEANVGRPLTVAAPGLLANDTDAEANALTAQLVTSVAPTSGTLALVANGGFTYTPAAGFTGAATFTYRAIDNGTPSASSAQPATVTINVRNAPPTFAPGLTAIPDQTATENVAFTANLATFFVDPEGAPLTFTVTGLPAGLVAAANGTISGTPSLTTGVGTFTINVVVSDGPNTLPTTFTLRVLAAGRTDIAVSAAATPNPALINQAITWTFTVENRSPIESVGSVTLEAVFAGPGALPITAPPSCVVTPQSDRTTMLCSLITGIPAAGRVAVTASGSSALPGDVLVVATVKIAQPTPIDETPQNDTTLAAVSIAETVATGPAQTLAATGLNASAAADLNGDGFVDLAVATSSGAAIYPNVVDPDAPGGTKRALGTQRVPIDGGGPSTGIAVADVDGDGGLDLVVARASGPSTVLRNPQDGSFVFTPLPATIGRAGDASNAIAARDLDGDGRADIVTSNSSPNRVFMNRGGGTFAETAALGNDDSRDVAAADLAGDAALELVFANANGNATLYRFDRATSAYVETPLATGPSTAVAVGDLDGDGRADLVFGRTQSKLVLFNVTPPGALPQFSTTPLVLGATPTADVLVADVDADGDLDIVAINASGGHQIYANGGTAQFTLRPQQFASEGARHATLAKLGADDRADVAIVGAASLDVFYSDGSGNFGRGDVGAPIIQLVGPASIDLTVEAVYTDAGATAVDAVDGNVTARIQVNNPVNTAVVGTYTVTYNVTDSSGNPATAVTRTVRVGVRTGTGGGGGGAIDFATLLGVSTLLLALAWPRRRRRNAS